MILNDIGKIIEIELLKSIAIREHWFFHNWVIMPNHIHLLVEIKNDTPISVTSSNVEMHCSASLHCASPQSELKSQSEIQSSKLYRKPNSISSFVGVFKSVTTKQINSLMENASSRDALQCISTRCVSTKRNRNTIWQSNYHDHIVRNYNSFDKIYHYIKNNPKNWDTDSINSN